MEFSRLLAEVSKEARPAQVNQRLSFWEKLSRHFRGHALQWGLAAACAGVMIVAIGSIRVLHNRDLRARSNASPREGQNVTPENANTHPDNTTNKPDGKPTEIASASPTEFTLRLDAGISRTIGSTVANTVSLPAKSSWLNLELKVNDEGEKSYVAKLEEPDGTLIQRFAGLKSRLVSGQSIVPLRLQSELIPPGDYVVELKTFSDETVDSYAFRVLRK